MTKPGETPNEETKTALATLKGLLPQLRKAKVIKITMDYNGSGDEGSYETPVFHNTEDQPIEVIPSLLKSTTDALENVMDGEYAGWWNGEGGTGTLSFDVKTGKLETGMKYYVVETTNENRTFKL